MKFLKKFEGFKINSKSVEVGEIVFPDFKGDKIYMLEFDLANPILPKKYKRWESVVNEMVKKSPVKTGKAYLTVDEEDVKPGESHRRGGVHVDGNFVYGYKDGKVVEIQPKEDGEEPEANGLDYVNELDWTIAPGPSSWATGFLVGGLNDDQHIRQYCSNKGGIMIASNYEACDGWNGVTDGIPLDGGDCSHIDVTGLEKFRLKANHVYLGNSTFLHESVKINEPVKRQMIRITLPEIEVI